jgi:hypothetical protein
MFDHTYGIVRAFFLDLHSIGVAHDRIISCKALFITDNGLLCRFTDPEG